MVLVYLLMYVIAKLATLDQIARIIIVEVYCILVQQRVQPMEHVSHLQLVIANQVSQERIVRITTVTVSYTPITQVALQMVLVLLQVHVVAKPDFMVQCVRIGTVMVLL